MHKDTDKLCWTEKGSERGVDSSWWDPFQPLELTRFPTTRNRFVLIHDRHEGLLENKRAYQIILPHWSNRRDCVNLNSCLWNHFSPDWFDSFQVRFWTLVLAFLNISYGTAPRTRTGPFGKILHNLFHTNLLSLDPTHTPSKYSTTSAKLHLIFQQ